jgi:hypothetical protein
MHGVCFRREELNGSGRKEQGCGGEGWEGGGGEREGYWFALVCYRLPRAILLLQLLFPEPFTHHNLCLVHDISLGGRGGGAEE